VTSITRNRNVGQHVSLTVIVKKKANQSTIYHDEKAIKASEPAGGATKRSTIGFGHLLLLHEEVT